MSDRRHRLKPVELYRMPLSRTLMVPRNYFCACPKQRVNILMNVTSIDPLLLLCHSRLSSFPSPPRRSPGSLSVSEVAGLLEQQTLQLLKKECGGLQTLLKNNHQVFRGSYIRPQIPKCGHSSFSLKNIRSHSLEQLVYSLYIGIIPIDFHWQRQESRHKRMHLGSRS